MEHVSGVFDIAFVGHKEDFFADFAESFGGFVVFNGKALFGVHDKEDEVGVGYGELDLGLDVGFDVFFGFVLKAARVDKGYVVMAHGGAVVDAVAGGAGYFGYDGVALADEPVKEAGFAHVGAADNGDDGCFGLHGACVNGGAFEGALC